jgi:serine protease Do
MARACCGRRLAALFLCATALAVSGCSGGPPPPANAAPPASPPAAAPQGGSWLDSYSAASAEVARAVAPAVAFVAAEVSRDSSLGGLPMRRQGVAEGSAAVIDAAGYLLTNQHVVDGASRVRVLLPSGEEYPAEVVGSDAVRDVAVLRVKPKGKLPTVTLGEAENLQPGAWAMAVGYPFGGELEGAPRFTPSVAVGVISATGREIRSDIPGRVMRGLIQTDAAINPGNSGGPLVDSHGRVVGVNEAIFTTTAAGGNIGVGFAIPIDRRTKEIIASLKAGRPIVRGQLGVLVKALAPEAARRAGVAHGVLVGGVQPNGPAARAGIQSGDIIIEYNGKAVSSPDEMVDMVQGTKPGTTVPVRLMRNGKAITVRVTVAQLPSS